MNLTLGHAGARAIRIDLDAMLRTRLLVQGNSGAGKSWLLRRLAEQLFGKVPVLILDPEGEFATLRERYGYVLVGKGGETPADTRSAALVAHKPPWPLARRKASAGPSGRSSRRTMGVIAERGPLAAQEGLFR